MEPLCYVSFFLFPLHLSFRMKSIYSWHLWSGTFFRLHHSRIISLHCRLYVTRLHMPVVPTEFQKSFHRVKFLQNKSPWPNIAEYQSAHTMAKTNKQKACKEFDFLFNQLKCPFPITGKQQQHEHCLLVGMGSPLGSHITFWEEK